jgi:hypothetical protein
MYLDHTGHLVLSPTDLVTHLACPHLTTLNRRAAEGYLSRPSAEDPGSDVVRRRGDAHEAAVLAEMGKTHRVVEIPRAGSPAEAERADGWRGVRAAYSLPHQDVRGMAHDLAYRALASGAIDVTDLFPPMVWTRASPPSLSERWMVSKNVR